MTTKGMTDVEIIGMLKTYVKKSLIGQGAIKGQDGFSPTVVVKTNTDSEYVLTITDANGSYDTPNLKGSDISLLADDFSAEEDYAKGAVVAYNGVLYQFDTNHSAGAWNSAEVTQKNVVDLIAEVSASGATYNVLDYGLEIGQVATINNSVALEAMITEIPAGSVIYFPQGVYRFATPITITKALSFVGENDFDHVNTTAGAEQPQSEILFGGISENTTLFTIDGVDVSFEGLSFFCQSGSTQGYSIQVNEAEFKGFPYPCFTSSVNRENVNCICAKDATAVRRLAVRNCTFRGFSGYALQITDYTFVRFCNFSGCGIGVQVSGTDNWIQNCSFVGCGICVKNVENQRWNFMNLAMSDTWADQIVDYVFTSELPAGSQLRLFFDNLWVDMVNKAAIYLPTQYLTNSHISGRFSRCGMSYAEDEAKSRIPIRDANSQDAMDAIVLNRANLCEFDIQINRREIGRSGNANGVCCAYGISSLSKANADNRVRVYDATVERAVYSPNVWSNTTIEGSDKSVLTDSIWMYDFPPVLFRSTTPVGRVIPRRAGMLACDYSDEGGLYRSTGTTNADWEIIATKPSNGKALVAKSNTLPTAIASRLGWTIMYMGATDVSTQKIHGAIYECVSDGAATPTYSWAVISIPMEEWKAIVAQCNDFADFKTYISGI